MRAVHLTERGELRFTEQHPIPQPGSDESLIRVSLSGICSTDLELVKGYFGFTGILGHEFVGTVERSSDPSWVGKRVVSTINFADPDSPQFMQFGYEHHPERSVLGILNRDGAMADYVVVPTRNMLAVPDSIADEAAVFTEPLAAALRIAEQVNIARTDRIAVVGVGRLGMLIGKVLTLKSDHVAMLARSEASLELPRQWKLATGFVSEAKNDCFDIVVEATGNPAGLEHALRLVRPLGTLVLKSTYAEAPSIDLTKVVVGEIKMVGSRCGPFAPALELLRERFLDVSTMIDGDYPIDQSLEAFAHAARPGIRKVILRI